MDCVTLAQILIRQGEKQTGGVRPWLDDLITTKWTDINAQNGQIIGTSVNGKSMTLAAPKGTSLGDIAEAAHYALSCLERGILPSRQTQGVLR
jgi:hypothetical protein